MMNLIEGLSDMLVATSDQFTFHDSVILGINIENRLVSMTLFNYIDSQSTNSVAIEFVVDWFDVDSMRLAMRYEHDLEDIKVVRNGDKIQATLHTFVFTPQPLQIIAKSCKIRTYRVLNSDELPIDIDSRTLLLQFR